VVGKKRETRHRRLKCFLSLPSWFKQYNSFRGRDSISDMSVIRELLPANLEDVPRDLVLKKLPCKDVISVCATDKAHKAVCRAERFWEEQYKARHQESVESAARFRTNPSVWPLEGGDEQQFGEECRFVLGRVPKTFEHDSPVNSVAFSPDGSTLATGSTDCTARLWNVATGENTATFRQNWDWVMSVAFSPDGRTLATGSWDRNAKIWAVV